MAACIPEALRGHLAAGNVESEHRRAAVAFVRFGGADQVLDTDSVEQVVDALEEAAAAHGACFLESDIDAIGGRIILVAGVPTTAGEDEERLLRTVRAAVDAQTTLPLHVGVAAGNVFAGRIGPPYRQAFTILGGTAALAARLMAKADGRSIWTTPDLLERSRTLFATEPVGALTLKGKAEPVDAVAVGAVSGTREPASPKKKLPLVDRQRELPVLDAALVPVRMGFGSFVELIGDAGIGKSRILEELCDRAVGLTLVTTGCEQYEATTPYFPFRKLLQGPSRRRGGRRPGRQLGRARRPTRADRSRARPVDAACRRRHRRSCARDPRGERPPARVPARPFARRRRDGARRAARAADAPARGGRALDG